MNHVTEVPKVGEEQHLFAKTRTRWTRNSRFVEPVFFSEAFSFALMSVVLTNLIEIQYCKAVLNVSDQTACLNTTAPHFTEVQKYTSTFLMYYSMCDAIFPVIFSIFLGPWSDTVGRRPLLLLSTLGHALGHFQYAWGSITNINPSYFLLFFIPVALSGGLVALKMATYCYICDITSIDTRAFRLGILFGSAATGSLVGTLVLPYLQIWGYSFVLGICTVASTFNFLYVMIFLKESVSTAQTQQKLDSKNQFQLSQLRNLFRTSQVSRGFIFVTLLIFVYSILSGENVILYLFLQGEFGWTLTDYSWLQSTANIFAVLMAVIGPSKMLNLSDLQLLTFVTGIHFLSNLILLLGQEKWLVFLAGAMSGISSMNEIIIRSFLSKVVHIDDLGKVFAWCGILESLTGIIGSPIYSMVYKETLDTNSRAVFLVSIVMCLLITLLIILLSRLNINKKESSLMVSGVTNDDVDANDTSDGGLAGAGSRIDAAQETTPTEGNASPSAKVKTIAAEIANLFEETYKENE